jgi:Tol biopolymer transport system component
MSGTSKRRSRLAGLVVAAVCMAVPMFVSTSGAAAAKNGPILFSDYQSIWKVKPNGTGLKRVAKKAAHSLHASPNGRTLLYTHGGLYRMPINGGRSTNLLRRYPIVDRMANVSWASWSPNGKRIVFAGYDDTRIYTIKANGRGMKYLFSKNRTGLMTPVWSPDGREIAFIDVWNGSSLMAVNLRTGKERRIYPGDGPAGTPVNFDWHPDGSRLAFYAPYRNWMINRDGSGLREISSGAYFDSYEDLVFSPDGTELLGRALPTGGTTSELWRLDGMFGAAEGGFVEEVTGAFKGSAFYPEWAPRPKKKPKR